MKEKRKWRMFPLIVLLVLASGLLLVSLIKGLWVRMLLDRVWEQEHMVCIAHMELPVEIDNLSVSWDTVGEERYFTIDAGTESVYFHDEKLFFSNGNGYDLEGLLDELNIPAGLLRNVAFAIPPERYFDEGYQAWKFQLPEEPGFLLKTLFPEVSQYWNQLQPLNISFYEESGWLRYILIQHESLYLYIELQYEEPDPIPTEQLMQMGTKPLPDIRTLEPLVRACLDLNDPGTVLADLSIRVDCGPLPIQDTGKIRFSEEGLYFSRGEAWTELTPDSVERNDLLLGLCWMLIREGVWEPDGTESGVFTLTIPSEELKTGLLSIIPELEGLDFQLDDGTMSIQVESNRFRSMDLTCAGQMPFLITTIPLSIQLELTVTG